MIKGNTTEGGMPLLLEGSCAGSEIELTLCMLQAVEIGLSCDLLLFLECS